MTGTQRKGRTHSDVGREVRVSSNEDTRQLLEMAFGLHQAGELARARGLYQRIIEQDPSHADALHFLGLACFQSGEHERAVELVRRAVELKPDVAPYHDNLGAVLESRGELEPALASFREAARLAGEDAERTFNMGVVLGRIGRYREAEAAYRRAIELAPGDAGFHYNLATLLKGRGRLEEAVEHFNEAIELQPDAAEARNNLGNALHALGRLDEATRAYAEAIRLRPNDAAAHLNLANVHRESSELEAAVAGYRRALALDPALDEARRALAELERRLGRFDAALAAYLALLERQPGDAAALVGLASVLRFAPVAGHRPDLCALIEACFESPGVQAQDLAAAAAMQVRAKHGLDDESADVEALVDRLAAEPLLSALLARTINIDAALERFLVRLRAHLARAGNPAAREPSRLALSAGIALQCFINEYVFTVSDSEERLVARRRAGVERKLAELAQPDDAFRAECALLAMYQPLLEIDGGERLARWGRGDWGDDLWPLVERTVREPLEERTLAGGIAAVGTISDSTSKAVREQYEQNPYPRWLDLPRREPVSYRDYLARRFRNLAPPEFLDGPVEVLAAGCGTGQEAVAIAAARARCRVLGLDLSRRSLAYAERMARKLAVGNVQFVQGDILNAGSLGRRFHIVESSGVLHHMDDPLAGWRALGECLEPRGLMKIGLYSERARGDIASARERIRAASLEPVGADIRAFRAEVLSARAGATLAGLADSEDFYTMSACRDLLFHVKEHAFTISAIAAALEELSLDFVGFEPATPGVLSDYARFNPGDVDMTDLSGWERFEESRPELFAALYVFWCQRRF